MKKLRLYLLSLLLILTSLSVFGLGAMLDAQEKNGNRPEARVKALQQEIDEMVSAAREKAVMMIRDNKYDDAVDILEKLHRSYPDNQPVLHDYVTTLAWAEQYQKAADLAGDLSGRQVPEYVLASAALAQRHSGRLNLAEKMYREGVERFPLAEDFFFGLALTLADDGRFDEARQVLKSLVTNGDARPESQAGEVALYIDRQEAAYQERELERQRELVRQRRDEAVKKARAGEYEEALKELSELYRENTEDQGLLADYMTVAAWAGWNKEAAELSSTLNVGEAPEYALATAASSLRQSGEYEEARRVYEEALARFPHDFELRLGLAWTLAELNQPVRALSILKEAGDDLSGQNRQRLAEARNYLNRMLPPPPPFRVPPRSNAAWRSRQDEAVALAREGQLEQGLAILEGLRQDYPLDQYLLGDYLVLRQWNREHEQVVALSKQLNLNRAPVFAIVTVAQSFARQNDWAGSEKYLERALAAQRRNPELLVAGAEVIALNGNVFKAARWLEEAEASRTPGLGHEVEAVKKRIGYERLRSLRDLQKANRSLSVNPANHSAMRLKVLALSGLGGAYRAKGIIDRGLPLAPEHVHNITWASGLREARWGELVDQTGNLPARNNHFLQSLEILDRLAARADCDSSFGCRTNTLMARVQPLYDLNNLLEAVAAYEATVGQGMFVRESTHLAAGGAYLGLRRPEEAALAYLAVINRAESEGAASEILTDDLYQAEKGLFWALLESEHLAEAREQARRNYRKYVEPDPGQMTYLDENWIKPDTMVVVGLAELFTGHYANGEEYFRDFLNQAPANTGARAGLSMTYSMRGLPRSAWEEAVKARVHNPAELGLAIREAQTLLDLRRWREAEELINSLSPWSPYSEAVKQLERNWETHNLREARIDIGWSHSDSRSPGAVNNSGAPSLEWRLYSQPLGYNWRAFVGSWWDGGKFEEGRAHQDVVLGGIEFRGRDLEVSLEARSDRVEDRRFGLGLNGVWELSDHIRIPFAAEKLSRETPLRARHSDIRADSASLGFEYYWNDYRWLSLSGNFMDFSDDNQRWSFSGNFNQRLWTWYTHYLTGHVNFYASNNSKDDDRPYFNPKDDLETGLGLTYGSVLWRRYDKSLSHSITAEVANYYQRYYDSDVVWNLGYNQNLDWTDRFSAAYGLGYGRRVYDGDPEMVLNSYLTLMWKF